MPNGDNDVEPQYGLVTVTQEELNILRDAKVANPYWYAAIMNAAEIMVERRKKYSGKGHPYTNFFDLAKRMRMSLKDVFDFYMNIKFSRLNNSGEEDFKDERVIDTLMDIINYAAIALGALLFGIGLEDLWEDHNPNAVRYPWPIANIDLDGVINTYDGWKGEYANFPAREGVLEFLIKLKTELGAASVIIFTANPNTDDIWKWLRQNELGFFVDDVTNLKFPARWYLDDRAVVFDGDFDKALEEMKMFKPHWEK